jgi:hypothetical protein
MRGLMNEIRDLIARLGIDLARLWAWVRELAKWRGI